jgi:hypothetical protein
MTALRLLGAQLRPADDWGAPGLPRPAVVPTHLTGVLRARASKQRLRRVHPLEEAVHARSRRRAGAALAACSACVSFLPAIYVHG